MRTINEIIEAAGGPSAIVNATDGKIDSSTVRRWRMSGIPDLRWPLFIELANSSPEELYAANQALDRYPGQKAAAE